MTSLTTHQLSLRSMIENVRRGLLLPSDTGKSCLIINHMTGRRFCISN